jgi:hypothetical protein
MTACISAAGLFLSFSMMSYMVSDSLGRLIFLNSTLSLILFFGFFLATRRMSKIANKK